MTQLRVLRYGRLIRRQVFETEWEARFCASRWAELEGVVVEVEAPVATPLAA